MHASHCQLCTGCWVYVFSASLQHNCKVCILWTFKHSINSSLHTKDYKPHIQSCKVQQQELIKFTLCDLLKYYRVHSAVHAYSLYLWAEVTCNKLGVHIATLMPVKMFSSEPEVHFAPFFPQGILYYFSVIWWQCWNNPYQSQVK